MSNPLSAFRAAAHALASALLRQDCFLCSARAGGSLLCAECHRALPRLQEPRCPICARPTPGGQVCGGCLHEPPHFDATLAVFAYAFPIDRLIQALKYRGRLAVAPFLGEALAGLPQPPATRLVPMSLHRKRLSQRGFNQALEIARPVAKRWRLPLDTTSVSHELDIRAQVGLPWDERQRNVRGAFLCRADLAGEHVVVVDDVMTTGATLDEFARTLKKRGAARVTNLVVARTLPP